MSDKSIIEILRTPKIFDMALFDWFFVLLFIYYLSNYVQKLYPNTKRNTIDFIVLIIIVSLGVITHKYFNIDTKFGYYLNLNKDIIR
jgi:hypothetical protein